MQLTVIEPIGDRIYSDATLEHVLLATQHHGSHVAAVTPTPHTHPRDVQVLESLQQVPQHGQLILNLDAADPPEQISFPLTPSTAHVQPDVHYVVVAGHVGAPVDSESIRHCFAPWTTVHFDQDRERRVSELLSPRGR